jgi:recombination protein U
MDLKEVLYLVFKYPNGKAYQPKKMKAKPKTKNNEYSNRGMTLEEDLNETNEYYLQHGIAVIHKKPTPVQIVDVHFPKRSAAVITEAYFKKASTTDYNGIYNGKYIDFEAKETQNKTSFPLRNFHDHQIDHMKAVVKQGGIAFVILRFSNLEECYLLDSHFLFECWNNSKNGSRKSIPRRMIIESGYQIAIGWHPRIDYLTVVDQIYFN